MQLTVATGPAASQRPRPSPHAPAEKKHEAAAGLGRQRFAEGCHTQRLILGCDGGRELEHAGVSACSSGSFFSNRSLDRPGVNLDVELLADQASPAREHEPARPATSRAWRNAKNVAVDLVGAAWARLLRAPVQQSRLHRSWPWSGSRSASKRHTPRRPRSPSALSTETRRSISYLTCTASLRIEELASLKLRIAHLLGRRIERALFEEGVGL